MTIAGARRLFAAAAVWIAMASPAWCGDVSALYEFGSNPGKLWGSVYRPSRAARPAPLVVVLHGCGDTGRAYAEDSGWTELAERFGWVLLLPEQPFFNNPANCFNWFDAATTRRDAGEALSIRQMIATVAARYGTNPGRVYVTGLSAGGAMTAVMLADYPELFAGGAILAGIPFGCATTLHDAEHCLMPGRDREPEAWARLVRAAAPAPKRYPRLMVWQGDRDTVVAPKNARALVQQWGAVQGLNLAAGRSDRLRGLPRWSWRDAAGETVLELVVVPGMDHDGDVIAGKTPVSCHPDAPAGAVCPSLEIARFWGLVPAR